jgi:hypothetical protein
MFYNVVLKMMMMMMKNQTKKKTRRNVFAFFLDSGILLSRRNNINAFLKSYITNILKLFLISQNQKNCSIIR